MPWSPPKTVNVKPSRFGPIRNLFAAYDYCEERGIGAYGGGQTELGPGRGQIQYLASIFHPDTPNDVAPGGYNDPARRPARACPPARCEPAIEPIGFRWALRGRFGPLTATSADRIRHSATLAFRCPAEKEQCDGREVFRRRAQRADRQRVRRLAAVRGAAVYYDAETLPRLASFFYRQALEEREHAMMMIRYLLDVGEEVHIPDIKSQ